MNRFTYILFLFFIYTFSFTPFWILYGFSDAVIFPFFYYIYRYRRNVILDNLRKAFPEKPEQEINSIMRTYYHHFSDILVEGVKAFSMSRRQILERYKVTNPEILTPFYEQKKSIIAVLGHYNNWEWGSIAAGLQIRHLGIGFYKPLSNRLIDDYIERTRAKGGIQLKSIEHTYQTFSEYQDKPAIFLMVADQNPPTTQKAIWVRFLNQDTATLHGPEKYARLFNLPVLYVSIHKVKRGFYSVTLEPLVTDPANIREGEITSKFMNALELQIRDNPGYWLWSHKRWKHKREPLQ